MASTFYAPYNQVVEACQQVGFEGCVREMDGRYG